MGHAFLQLFFFRPPFLCRHRLIASRTPRSFSHDDMPATNSRVVAFDEDDEYRRRAVKKARRLKLAVAVQRRRAAAAIMLLMNGQGPQGRKRRPQSPFSWEDHVARLTEPEFKQRYRLNWDSFQDLLRLIRDDISVEDEQKARHAKWGAIIKPEVKLAIALRYLAGGSHLDLRLIYHVSSSFVYSCVWLVVDAINKHLNIEFPIDDIEKLKRLEAEFRAQSRGGIWAGQVSAIDGVHFKITAPSNEEVEQKALKYYVQRKAEYALLCIAMCDAKRRFTFYDISSIPTTHDALAWDATGLGQRIKRGDLPSPFFINGDAAFSLSNSMITPSGDAALDDFDYHQSSNRMPIECAFGILVRRWGIFWRALSVRFDRRAALIGACMRLHNFCIDHNLSEDTRLENGLGCIQPGRWEVAPIFDREGRPVRMLHGRRAQRLRVPRGRKRDKAARRDILAGIVDASGLCRPAVEIRKRRGRKGRRGRGPG